MRILKKIVFSMILAVLTAGSYAQQFPQISGYMFNSFMLNPAYAGFGSAINATALHRQQWYGFKAAPQVTIVTVESPIVVINSGVGITMINDIIGIFKNTTLNLAYNYKFDIGDGQLSIGTAFGFRNIAAKLEDAVPPTGVSDQVINDARDASTFLFNLDAGVYYQMPDKFEVGVAMTDILAMKSNKIGYQGARTLNVTGNYVFQIPGLNKMDFVPSVLLKTDFTAFQADISLVGIYNKTVFGGLSYRLLDAVVFMAGATIKNIQFGISYDLATNKMIYASKMAGGFEVWLRYSFKLSVDRNPKSTKNARYL
ncbi:MAG: PorP/SprF family type IX secretion system membrane protein [Bacteroidales bacterium]|jgi:type IX secretion system PorP/SprF family membrane protein|nr:PorP/SprF family type IX secretion system membrane protein [Bacteroidales bacterium]